MIEIKKKEGKWKKGDRPTLTKAKQKELVDSGIAKYIGDPKEYSLQATDEGIKELKTK